MDQKTRTTDVYRNENDLQQPAASSTEVRTLSELELVLCGGGEQSVNWPG